jgi:hypothetical protein
MFKNTNKIKIESKLKYKIIFKADVVIRKRIWINTIKCCRKL